MWLLSNHHVPALLFRYRFINTLLNNIWNTILVGTCLSSFPAVCISLRLDGTREIHPLDPQPHRYCMLASTASAPRVTCCSLGLYWSRDLCTAGWLAGWGMLSYLGQIVRGSEIWWFMTSGHSLSTSLRWHLQWKEIVEFRFLVTFVPYIVASQL